LALTLRDEDDIALAQQQSVEVIREMREAGTLTVSNGHSIRRLIEFRVQYKRMARHVAERGLMITAKRRYIHIGS
jgi:hypothetical protein